MRRWLLELVRFDGRLGRLAYWRAWLRLTAIGTASLLVGYLAIIRVGPLGAVLLLPAGAAMLANVPVAVRRLHDRGKSGWWLLAFVGAPVLGSGWMREIDPGGTSPVTVLIALMTLALELWALVEIGFMSGTRGFNRYGHDPLQAPPAEVFA